MIQVAIMTDVFGSNEVLVHIWGENEVDIGTDASYITAIARDKYDADCEVVKPANLFVIYCKNEKDTESLVKDLRIYFHEK